MSRGGGSGSTSLRSPSSLKYAFDESGIGGGGGYFEFQRRTTEDDEDHLKWAAIERLPTYDRLRKGILSNVVGSESDGQEIDVSNLGVNERKILMESLLRVVEEDNEKLLRRIRQRTDVVGIQIPTVEIRFEDLSVEGDGYVGTRALPTLANFAVNTVEGILGFFRVFPTKKRVVKILHEISGIVKPSRMTLLLGPPGSGKTTLLKALSGKTDKNLRVAGRVTYCGHEFDEFVPQRTCSYISQQDRHLAEMTVRETLEFSGRCLGVGAMYDLLAELSRREKAAGIKPDLEIDAFMKATSFPGQENSLVVDYVIKLLGLDICADILVGNDMRRGISGGQKKRVTTGEMLVGPAKVFLMDEISTGLDSSTTYQIVRFMKEMVHIMDITMVISLLQPAPETFELFDNIILLSEGQIVYQGPRENVLEFFESVGFKCPERKGVADFLQEVTSKNDQEQYWSRTDQPYRYISVLEFVTFFNSYSIGRNLSEELAVPYDRSTIHRAALVQKKYGISNKELLKTCFARESLLLKRNAFVYIFKTTQLTIMSIICMTVFLRTEMKAGHLEDGNKFYGAMFYSLLNIMFTGISEVVLIAKRLPEFYKQRDSLFYPAWAFALPVWILRIPIAFIESFIWIVLTYYTIGFAPAANRFFKQFLAFLCITQMAQGLFRCIGAVARSEVLAPVFTMFVLLVVFVMGGFVISKDDIQSWMIWSYYISPMMYGQNAIVINEFLDDRWNPDPRIPEPTVGKAFLRVRGMFVENKWYWISIGMLIGFTVLYNILFVLALTYLDRKLNQSCSPFSIFSMLLKYFPGSDEESNRRGMVLPFQPLSLAFSHVNYYVDMPPEMKSQGVEDERLQLLHDVSGAFRPGVLTALVGVSGAGKTTLMDVLAGRKTGGLIEGTINISGYPKNQQTFARISGYCEQNDIHSPRITVYESLLHSAWLRLSKDVSKQDRQMFIEEVMELIELGPLRNSIVGLPGVNGLSTEQRKRLTIAVELVANPSIIFMDEPTSGLDARAAAIVMRTVRNTVDTGRTVVCTIHQPSIDIFESFDELLLMKRGGQMTYAGSLGRHSHKLIEYFEAVPGVPKIQEGTNPATWMLDISSAAVESQLNVDFAEIYSHSELYKRNQELIKELSTPTPGSRDLHFPTQYAQDFLNQFAACFMKQNRSYWQNPQYNGTRFLLTTGFGLLFGLIFWNKGQKTETEQDVFNLLGATYCSVAFLGGSCASGVMPVVSIERTILYREKAAGMYSELAYAIAQVSIETIYVALQTFIYSVILFLMIGYPWHASNFLWFYFFVFMSFLYYTLYGMMLLALTPSYPIAAIAMSFFLAIWNLFSGFLIIRRDIPIWWRWYYWASPLAWTVYGLFTSQLGDIESPVEVVGQGSMPVNQLLKQSFGFDYDFLPAVAAAHIGIVLIFLFTFAYGIKFLNFQRR
ncbi:Pleiotropic drug resistance protein 2 [Linum perenne]